MTPILQLETFAPRDTTLERRADETLLLTSRRPLETYEGSVAGVLRKRAAEHPERVLAAGRDEHDGWRPLTYGEAREKADALAQALLDLGLGPARPLMVLSGNSIEHLLLSLGAYTAGVPVMPISVAYSLMSGDHARIKAIAELTQPALVFADDAVAFGRALDAVRPHVSRSLVARGARDGALRFDDLVACAPTTDVEKAYDSVGPDTVAKLLFTSGSTGVPKGVINTNRMLCANQAMLRLGWPFIAQEPPVLVDWLPWSHTFGANHNLGLVLFNGGTLYLDDGKPAPPLFRRTLSALRDVSPTVYFNVPAGYALLAPALEGDAELAERFFSRLRFMFYAGAALPEALALRLRELAGRIADHEVPLTSSWGTTETAPAATSAHFADAPPGCIGVPLPGVRIKLAPSADKLEIRVSAPSVTPGYYRQPELWRSAFDEEGFYCSGDAVKLIDESDPNLGLRFDGRISEDFKLLTGTWVTVGPLRLALLSAAGALSDAVICGQDSECVGALAWLNQVEARRVTGEQGDVTVDDPRIREHLAGALAELDRGAGSARRVERLLLLSEPPSLDAGEITDKGYINQRACLERRAADVARLYGPQPDPAVITPGAGSVRSAGIAFPPSSSGGVPVCTLAGRVRRRFIVVSLTAVTLALQAVLASFAGAALPAWTTYRHDAARSGSDPDSTSPLTPSQAWQTSSLDGEVYGQPLVYGSFVYVATENDTVYKLDAATGTVAWAKHLAAPEPSSAAPCGDISPSIGVTGTPVIDPGTNRIYAVGAVSASGAIRHELFALDLDSGQQSAGFPITVDPPFPSGGSAVNQLQRAGLALDAGRILIGYGGNDGDCNTYWGWLVSAPTNGSTGLNSFQVDRDYEEGAIWAAGNAPVVDSSGNVFLATGNGTSSNASDPEYGDSVVKLNATASPLDYWSPTNWQSLDSSDADLGSSMPTLLPGGYLFQSGKDGNGYLVNGAALGHVSSPARQVSGFCSGGSFGGSVYDPATSTIYAACSSRLRALSLGSGSPPTLATKPGFTAPSGTSGPPMIAGGLVWVIDRGSATLYGLDPTSGSVRSSLPIPENGSEVNHFATPSAGAGRLFVGSGDQVTAFTIAQQPASTSTTTSLVASPNPATAGRTVSLTAQVSPTPDAGTVTFVDGSTPMSSCAGMPVSPASGARAVCNVAFGGAGAHRLKAIYSGSAFFAGSVSAVVSEAVTSSGPPVLSRTSISPRRFTARRGATLQLNVNENATVIVAVTQLRNGHVVRRHCSPRAQKGTSCRVRVTLVRLHLRAHRGRNSFKLALRKLAAGHYTALIYANDARGRRSRTARIAFTILPPKR